MPEFKAVIIHSVHVCEYLFIPKQALIARGNIMLALVGILEGRRAGWLAPWSAGRILGSLRFLSQSSLEDISHCFALRRSKVGDLLGVRDIQFFR